ncbi:hypothetical protein BNJ_00302 [Kaumoebavirus]|uniref:hypothetical protein n=1 Tax=Kaumoebavirus TaxID=1859492 RepID=UPI0009C3AFBC|nr:hypothetical protein BNJ_00302 [Kaumoebavirus]ARA72124.1 hypothetical protein BNJ_00302 [Kaumoebavirus]
MNAALKDCLSRINETLEEISADVSTDVLELESIIARIRDAIYGVHSAHRYLHNIYADIILVRATIGTIHPREVSWNLEKVCDSCIRYLDHIYETKEYGDELRDNANAIDDYVREKISSELLRSYLYRTRSGIIKRFYKKVSFELPL